MKKMIFTLAVASLFTFGTAYAQVIYSLPSTTINLNVTAEKETFLAGPYAKYAQKYLGAPAKTANGVSYSLKEVTVTPYVEADPAETHTIRLAGESLASASFLQMCAQGIVLFSDARDSKKDVWRFPSAADKDAFSSKDLGENLTSATTTLYKNVKSENGFNKVAVQQSEVVEKSLEKKAAEAAQRIFDLRKSRIQIVTGDTDATYSGEAMGAALKEITRLEQEYLSLFYGIAETSEQKMNFDVVPTSTNPKQMYVAFRLSETEGLLPSSDVTGRPVILELTLEQKAAASDIASAKKSSGVQLTYRIPVTATARLIDNQKVLLQTRIPVYQLGTKTTITL